MVERCGDIVSPSVHAKQVEVSCLCLQYSRCPFQGPLHASQTDETTYYRVADLLGKTCVTLILMPYHSVNPSLNSISMQVSQQNGSPSPVSVSSVKVKVVPVLPPTEHHSMKAYWESGGTSPLL